MNELQALRPNGFWAGYSTNAGVRKLTVKNPPSPTLNGSQARFADGVAALALGVQETETGSRDKEVDGVGSVDVDAADLEFTGDWAMSMGLSR
jgi:hypothetical protein